MNEVTLTSFFQSSKDSLKERLQGLRLPKDYVGLQQIINKHIENLLVSDNNFSASLNASDAEMLNHTLRMALSFQKMSLTKSLDYGAMSTKVEYEVLPAVSDKSSVVIENGLSFLPTILSSFINPWLTVVVGAGTIVVKMVNKKGQKVKVVKKKKDVSRIISDEEINQILSGLENLCIEVDCVIAKIQRDRKDLLAQAQNKLDDCTFEKMYPQVLTSLQYIFKEYIKSGKNDQLVQNLLFSMEGYGYELVEYSDSVSGFFTKKLTKNVSETVMYLPAIVKNKDEFRDVVVPGIVYIPSK